MREFRDEVRKGVLMPSAGGIMPPGAFMEFMQEVEHGSVFMQNIQIDTITRPTQELQSLSAATRLLRAADTSSGYTAGTVTPKVRTFTPTRCGLALDVGYDWLDDNADGRNADEVIRAYLAELVQRDLIDLAGNGDGTTSGFLATNKGFTKLAADDSGSDVHLYDAQNAIMLGASGVLANLKTKMPTQYRAGSIFFMSVSEGDTFIDELGARATLLGDQALQSGGPFPWHEYKIVPVPFWPNDKVIMTPKWNLRLGMWKDINVASVNNPRKSLVEYTVEMRLDFQYANGDALCYGTTD